MKTVYLLIGLPGAGKTTFSKRALSSAFTIELDKVRQQMSDAGIIGKIYSSLDNKIVFAEFHKQILKAIGQHDEIIVDATNARKSERQEIYDLLAEYKPKFVIVNFADSQEVAVERILKRQQLNPNCVHFHPNPKESVAIYAERIKEGVATFDEPIAEIWTVKDGKILNKKSKVLIASKNLGKIWIYEQVCDELGIAITSLAQIAVNEEVEETGKTEIENAILKAEAYHKITGLPVISNDSGLIIDKFAPNDQPGLLVRRFGGRELTDQQMLEIYIKKLNEVGGESDGHYNVALALIDENGQLFTKLFTPHRHFINKASKVLVKGVPLSSLEYDSKTNKYLSEMTTKERNDYEAEAMAKQKDFIKQVFVNKGE